MELLLSSWAEMDAMQIAVLALCAVLVGVNKSGVPAIGTLPVVLLTLVFDSRENFSIGLQLLMLCAGDLLAVACYRSKANWKLVWRLLPSALAGIALGTVALEFIDARLLRPTVGIVILFLSAVNFVHAHCLKSNRIPSHWIFCAAAGITAGFTTQVANAAGPVMALYLLSMRLPPVEYMGTCAWYFLILNYIKLPVFLFEGRVSMESFCIALPALPLLVAGVALGFLFVKRVPQKTFGAIIELLVVLSAIKLLF